MNFNIHTTTVFEEIVERFFPKKIWFPLYQHETLNIFFVLSSTVASFEDVWSPGSIWFSTLFNVFEIYVAKNVRFIHITTPVCRSHGFQLSEKLLQ